MPDRVIAEREGVTVQAIQYLRYRSDEDDESHEDPRGVELSDSMYD